MRSELVSTHFTCNQNCRFCNARRGSDDPEFIRTAAVRQRIDLALAGGARELVLSGGEPTMRRDLELLVAYARSRKAEAVVLETNATLLDERRAAALQSAGLTSARVQLAGWGAGLDEVTRDPGGFERTLVGLRALLFAKIPVQISVAITRSTAPLVEALPGGLAEAFANTPELRAHLKGLTVTVPVASPDPEELIDYDAAAGVIERLDAACRRTGLSVKIAPDSGPPPCVFPRPSRVAHLYSLTAGARPREDHRHLAACERCEVRDRCSGLPLSYLARFPEPTLRPVEEDRLRRRLSLISSVEEQVRREFVQPNRYADRVTGKSVDEVQVRVNFHCNQACRFCFVSTHLPPPEDAAIRDAIVDAARKGIQITLTGGEPTLNSHLVEYVALARRESGRIVSLQTNAIRLAEPRLTDELVAAGVGWVQVSLHATQAELSDAITEAPGTFEKTVRGLDNLHRHAHVYIVINFVITQRNFAELVPFVRMLHERWPRALANISFVGLSSDVVPKEKALAPKYSEVLPHLSAAIAEARRLGVEIGGFESMCGVPLCLVPVEDRYFAMTDIPAGWDGGEMIRPPVCATCDLNTKCYGVRRAYNDLYGSEELSPVHALASATGVG